jgi:hypothetical protein
MTHLRSALSFNLEEQNTARTANEGNSDMYCDPTSKVGIRRDHGVLDKPALDKRLTGWGREGGGGAKTRVT